MSKTVLAWLEKEMTSLTANIHRHQGVGAYMSNCQRWEVHLEAYRKLYEVLHKPRTNSLDKNASDGKAKGYTVD